MGTFTHLKHRQRSPYRDSATKGVHKVQDLRPGSPCLQAQLISSPTVTIPLAAVTKALGLQLEGAQRSPRGAPGTSPCSLGWVSNHCSQLSTSISSRVFSQFPQEGTGTTPTRCSDISPPPAAPRHRPVPSPRRREQREPETGVLPRVLSAEGKRLMHISQEISALEP